MAKMLYSVTMSLDGFIAGPDGDMSWLTEHLGPNPIVDELIDTIGALLVGHRTFRGTNIKLERLNVSHAPQATNLWLRVVR